MVENKYEKSGNVGMSGEALVLACLLKHGHVATLTYKNTKNFDILACTKDGDKMFAIQVKSSGTTDKFIIPDTAAPYMEKPNTFFAMPILDKGIVIWIPGVDMANYIKANPITYSPRTVVLSKAFGITTENIEVLEGGNKPTYYRGQNGCPL